MAKTTTLWINGRPVVAGAAASRCYEDLVEQRGKQVADELLAGAIGRMGDVGRLFPDARGLETFDIVVEGMLLAAGVPESGVPELARRYRSGSQASVDLSGFNDSRASPWDILFDGSPDEIREFLEERLGTPDFELTDQGAFTLRLPLVDTDRRPRHGGETTLVRVQALSAWSVEAPESGGWWHAVPAGDRRALCTLDTGGWKGSPRRDDTHEVTCPWCRLRLIAMEIVAPPGPRRLESGEARSTKPSTHTVAAQGVSLVIGEIRRRGGKAVHRPAPGARNRVEVEAPDGSPRTVEVKTRRSGDWQTDTRKGRERVPDPAETTFWVLVDLIIDPASFFVVPQWWIENNIFEVHSAYLAAHGGTRAQSPDSTHHRIPTDRVEQWRARWELLGLKEPTSGGDRPKLHDEIVRILGERNAEWMSTKEIADEVNAAGRYLKQDRSPVTAFQIHGRTRQHPQLFERDGSLVRLR